MRLRPEYLFVLLMILCMLLGFTISASVTYVPQSAEVDGCRLWLAETAGYTLHFISVYYDRYVDGWLVSFSCTLHPR